MLWRIIVFAALMVGISKMGAAFIDDTEASSAIDKGLSSYQKHKNQVFHHRFIVVIDYTLHSSKERLFIVSPDGQILRKVRVAHGQGSSHPARPGMAQTFSNKVGSHKTSLGAMITGKIYHGKYGKSREIHGLEKGINDNAFKRRIVMHPARYMSSSFLNKYGYSGRSYGCLALDPKIAQDIISILNIGTFVYSYGA